MSGETGEPHNIRKPTLGKEPGPIAVGLQLSVDAGDWSVKYPPAKYLYEWYRTGRSTPIRTHGPVATVGDSYTVTKDDIDQKIHVEVTAWTAAGAAAATGGTPVNSNTLSLSEAPANTDPPTLSGPMTPHPADILAVDNGKWTGTQVDVTDQWQACTTSDPSSCTDISGETTDSYVVDEDDIGKYIRVEVVGANNSDPDGVSVGTTPRGPVESLPIDIDPNDTGVVTINDPNGGDPYQNDELTFPGNTIPVTGSGTLTRTWDWYRCTNATSTASCSKLPGTKDLKTYIVTEDDIGKWLRVLFIVTDEYGQVARIWTPPIGPILPQPPRVSDVPAPSGSISYGSTLTADPGDVESPGGTEIIAYHYQWERCESDGANCVAISGATDQTYTLDVPDVGNVMRVTVAAENIGGIGDSVESDPTNRVLGAPPINITPPIVTGTAQYGQVLTTTMGTWQALAEVDTSVQWFRCDRNGENCSAIPGQIGSTYVMSAEDIDRTIRSQVSATTTCWAGCSTPSILQSAPSGVVADLPPVNVGIPLVTGSLVQNATLTTSNGTWAGSQGTISYEYQWSRCAGMSCSPIAGATGRTYVAQSADVGYSLQATVYARAVGTGAVAASSDVVTSDIVMPAKPGVWHNTSSDWITFYVSAPEGGAAQILVNGRWEKRSSIGFSFGCGQSRGIRARTVTNTGLVSAEASDSATAPACPPPRPPYISAGPTDHGYPENGGWKWHEYLTYYTWYCPYGPVTITVSAGDHGASYSYNLPPEGGWSGSDTFGRLVWSSTVTMYCGGRSYPVGVSYPRQIWFNGVPQ